MNGAGDKGRDCEGQVDHLSPTLSIAATIDFGSD